MSWLQEQNEIREDYKYEGKYQRKVTLKSIFCNKSIRGWIFLTIFASSVPILAYYLVIDKGSYKTKDSYTCLVENTFRILCGKVNITSNDCEKIHCCFDKSTEQCYHYLPSRYSYDLDKDSKEYVAAQKTTPYSTSSIKKLQISINEINEDKVSVILHEPSENVQVNSISDDKNYKVNLTEQKLMVEIYRSNNGDRLLSTTKGPLIASENYWEWSFYLTNQFLFGLNQTLIKMDENSTFTKVIYKNKDDHYTLPVIWAYQNEQFHGVTIKHDGPLEITILPSNLIILKSLTGERIELELSIGPTPKFLHDQQLNTYSLPPYWALETHMCRRGDNVNLTELIDEFNINDQTSSDCIHENLVMAIMNDNGRNLDGIRDILTQIKEQGIKFLLSIPPHVLVNSSNLYNVAENLDILYKYDQSIYKGMYFNEEVAYPDYSHPTIQSYMTEFNTFLSKYIDTETIDGFILYDNWPVNDNYEIDKTVFPYLPQELEKAMSNTLPWNTTVNNGSTFHIRNHNTYGSAQITAIENYYNSTKHDVFIMSATKLFGQSQPPIFQNIDASWTNLQEHVDNMLFNSIIGNHLVSIPVCGDTKNFSSSLQETLCIRWYLVAVTMPIFKISSTQPWRDPRNLNTVFAQKAALSALQRRNMLLPYYYTLLNKKEPVVRPMFYDYYENTTTFSLQSQYMVGENILVAHPFSTGRTRLQIYLPSRIGIWYELWAGEMYNSTDDPWINIDIVETDFVGFISQGTIIPLQDDNILNLIIGLNCTNSLCEANGNLFQENYITFSADETTLTVTDMPQLNCNYTLGNVRLYYYANDTSVVKYYDKNKDLCTGESNIYIDFENEIETFV